MSVYNCIHDYLPVDKEELFRDIRTNARIAFEQ